MRATIKAQHQQAVLDLMSSLGGVSVTDAIGYLIQTQILAALERLRPEARNFGTIHPVLANAELDKAGQNCQQDKEIPQDSQTDPPSTVSAEDALNQLLNS
ncbi:MAG: DUF3383 domain-containing protein [Symploca sp. SIO2E6]|nr:DUF3383 domain-containing protein [Symploca sp. SIO2E6]